jgi:hypothetical protein
LSGDVGTHKIGCRIAVIATAFTPSSHCDVILRRWLDPLPTDVDYEWPGPRSQIASLFVLQESGGEEGLARCKRHGIRLCSSIGEALTENTEFLTVDAVMLLAEHGDFPHNVLGQKLYPRKELLDEILAVFKHSGKVVPLYFDKHFSWDPATAREMYWALEDQRIPWFGGSSLSLCSKEPPPGDLQEANFQEVVMTTWGELEGYLFHALEVLESVVEQREGGETGIHSVIAWKDGPAWEAMDRGEFSRDLLDAALAVVPGDAFTTFQSEKHRHTQEIQIFQLRYRDGLKATIVRLPGLVRKWAVGCRLAGRETSVTFAPLAGGAELFYPHFARLSRRIEDFFLGGPNPVPRTRLYLTTLACAYCLQALAQSGCALPNSEIPMPPVGDHPKI